MARWRLVALAHPSLATGRQGNNCKIVIIGASVGQLAERSSANFVDAKDMKAVIRYARQVQKSDKSESRGHCAVFFDNSDICRGNVKNNQELFDEMAAENEAMQTRPPERQGAVAAQALQSLFP